MSSHNHQYPTGRMQAESLSGSRLRSDSNIAASVHVHDENGDGIVVHGVQERARTAVLPPIMVSPSPYPYHKVFPKLGTRLGVFRAWRP